MKPYQPPQNNPEAKLSANGAIEDVQYVYRVRLCDASLQDSALLANMNRQLIEDEGSRNPMSLQELEQRMLSWLSSPEWRVVLIEVDGEPAGYCLYTQRVDAYFPQRPEIYVRHFFVSRHCRRQGIGTAAFRSLMKAYFPPDARLVLDVLVTNQGGLRFWQSLGFEPCCMTLELVHSVANGTTA